MKELFQTSKDHASSRGATGNAIPSYFNPLLTAHAVQRSRRPTGRQQGGTCQKCGTSHERGNCPVYGVKCHKCGGINHFKFVVLGMPLPARSKEGSLRIRRKASSSETDGHLGTTTKARAEEEEEAMAKEVVHQERRNLSTKTRGRRTLLR